MVRSRQADARSGVAYVYTRNGLAEWRAGALGLVEWEVASCLRNEAVAGGAVGDRDLAAAGVRRAGVVGAVAVVGGLDEAVAGTVCFARSTSHTLITRT
jgi:hypothetical protein